MRTIKNLVSIFYVCLMLPVIVSCGNDEERHPLNVYGNRMSECLNDNYTRITESLPRATYLVLKRDGNRIDCQIQDFLWNCGLKFYASAEFDDKETLLINVSDKGESMDCTCYFNTYFYVEGAVFSHFHLKLKVTPASYDSRKPFILYDGDVELNDDEHVIELPNPMGWTKND